MQGITCSMSHRSTSLLVHIFQICSIYTDLRLITTYIIVINAEAKLGTLVYIPLFTQLVKFTMVSFKG